MDEFTHRKHSKSGIYSCIIGILTWSYVGILILDIFYKTRILEPLFQWLLEKGAGDNSGREFLVASLSLLVLLLFIPIVGSLTGIVFGFIGVRQQNKNKLFAVFGLIINLLIPVSIAVFFILRVTKILKL